MENMTMLFMALQTTGATSTINIGMVFAYCFLGGITAIMLIKMIYKYLTCTVPIKAVCVGADTDYDENTTYTPIWEYEYHGQYIRTKSKVYSGAQPKTGAVKTLYINPNQPKKFRRQIPEETPFLVVCIVLAVILASFGT
jgi:hypothetical protein